MSFRYSSFGRTPDSRVWLVPGFRRGDVNDEDRFHRPVLLPGKDPGILLAFTEQKMVRSQATSVVIQPAFIDRAQHFAMRLEDHHAQFNHTACRFVGSNCLASR
jgi:hypothetical protein